MRWRRLEVKWLWTGHLYPRRAPASRKAPTDWLAPTCVHERPARMYPT